MTLQDHMIRRFYNFTTLPSLVVIAIVVIGNIICLICHVTLQDHAIKGSSDIMEGRSLWYITILPGLVDIGMAVVEI